MEPDWRVLVERSLSGVALLAADGTVGYANGRLAELVGVAAPQDLFGTPVALLLTADDADTLAGWLGAALGGRPVLARPARLVRRDGWRLPVELTLWPHESEGRPGLHLEVRDRVNTAADLRVLQELAAERDTSRALLAALTHGYAFGAIGGVLVEVNDVLCDIVGYTREELLGTRPPYPFWIPEQAEVYARAVTTVTSRGAEEAEVVWRRKDGEPITVALSARAVRRGDGEVIGYVTLAQDVTTRSAERAALQAMQTMLLEAQRQAKMGSWSWDIAADRLTWSDGLYAMLGLDRAAGITADGFVSMIVPADRASYLEAVDEVIRTVGEGTHEHRVTRPDGSVRTLLGTARAQLDEATGRVLVVSGSSQDITELRQHESDLAAGLAQLEAIAAASRAVLTDPEPRRAICEAARDVCQALAVTLLEVRGARLVATSTAGGGDRAPLDRDLDDATSILARVASSGQPVIVSDTGAHAVTDLPGAQAALCVPVFAARRPGDETAGQDVADGRVVGVLAVALAAAPPRGSVQLLSVLEILAQEAALAIDRADLLTRLVRQARSDGLTGLANRRTWDEDFPRELDRARRTGRPLCVAMLDLDDFKAFNDAHGHPAGDQLLRDASAAWQGRLRSTDLLARYGGEEFALAMPDCDLMAGEALLARLRAAMPAGATVSAGLARWDGYEGGESLLARADRGLYAAKRGGKSRTGIVG